jgi:hypothetical protein
MSESSTASIVLGLIATALASIAAYLTQNKAPKKEVEDASVRVDKVVSDAKELEHRLTFLEASRFTDEDRKCLQETAFQVKVIWTSILKDFPSLLKKESTPRVDKLIDKAVSDPKQLSEKEKKELITYLNKEYEESMESPSAGRGVIAALYRAVLVAELKRSEVGHSGCK